MRGFRSWPVSGVFALIAVIAVFGFLSIVSAPAYAQSENDIRHAKDQIEAEMARDRNLTSYNRVSGLLTDLLRDQKRLAANAGDMKNNENFAKAEDYLNEAGLYASQNNYDDCFKSMQAAFDILTAAK